MAPEKQRRSAQEEDPKGPADRAPHVVAGTCQHPPRGRARGKPGTSGTGKYYHIEVRPKADFTTFRTQDVGKKGGIQRVAGKRESGSWDTQSWLIGKDLADVEEGRMIPKTQDAEEILDTLGSTPKHREGDRFTAKPRPNIPERAKPTPAQQLAQQRNIKQAQTARRRVWQRRAMQRSGSQ